MQAGAYRPGQIKEELSMDIQKIITELLSKLNADGKLAEKFKADPTGTVTSLLGSVQLDNDQLKAVVEGVKAKLKLDDAAGVLNTLGGLFGGKK